MATGASFSSAAAKSGVSPIFSRTHSPRATSTAEKRKGIRQPQRAKSASLKNTPSSRNSPFAAIKPTGAPNRSEEHTSDLQSLMRSSYDVFCLKKKTYQLLI